MPEKPQMDQLRHLFEEFPIGICVIRNNRFDYVNQKFAQALGYAQSELAGMLALQVAAEEDRPLLAQLFSQANPVIQSELKMKRKSGQLIDVEIYGQHMQLYGGRAILAVMLDVTEQKLTQKALRQSEARYRNLFDGADDIIYTCDLAGNFTSINKKAEKLTGYNQSELLSKSLFQLIAPESAHGFQKSLIEELACQVDIICKDGRRLPVEITSKLIYQEGKPVGIQGIARDISERRHLEEQLRQSQKMEAIGRLAGGIAHDFNNLLTAIIGFAQLTLTRMDPSSPLRDNLQEIIKAGGQAVALIDQLLIFSRKQAPQPQVLNLNALITNSARMLSRLLGEDVELITILDPNLGHIRADQSQIEQVIMNLAINARDAMPGGGKLIIETTNVYLDEGHARHHIGIRPGHYVMLAMSDTGIGMDQETLSHIFEPFFTTKEKGKGTGLGLSTVYGIVKQSGGHIMVYSEPGRGTTFKICFPLTKEAIHTGKVKTEEIKAATGSETILVVEDEDLVRRFTTEVLQLSGYNVLQATDGFQALTIAQEHSGPIHLLLTDVVMPRMGGIELATKVAQMRPETKILLMSGYTKGVVAQKYNAGSGINFLTKPYSPHELTSKIREILDKGLEPSAPKMVTSPQSSTSRQPVSEAAGQRS
jgi:PAS domain S-box-containing protein